MSMIRHTDEPGSAAWHQRRARCFNAGDASAMLGCHPSGKTRSQLLQELYTGIEREFTDYVQEKVVNPGHRIEALWRPIAEEIIGEELYVLGGSLTVEGLSRPLGASLDGLTVMEDTAGECKSANEALRAALPHTGRDSHACNDSRQLPKGYRTQLEQQQLVTGATRTLFSAMDFDGQGNVIEERHCWYESDPALRAEILAGWKQFDADLAAYVPTEIKERPAAEATLALPALVIHAKGEITTSNMKEYGEALAKRLAEVRAIQLVTDQDFSNAKESAKLLRENIQQAKLAKEQMLAQTVTVGEAARMIDTWCEDMRLTALKLEQDVAREDAAKKAAMIADAKGKYERHIEFLKLDTGGPWILLTSPNWPEAIKGKRNFASMQDALDTMLANAKIVADESARKIRAALAALDEEAKGYGHLFADRLSFISKPADDVRALVKGRIAEHKAAEERRAAELAERERARIRQEEEARAAEKVRQEQAAEDALVASIRALALRIEGDSVAYIQKAINAFEVGARDWDRDPRPRVTEALAAGRKGLADRLAAAQEQERETAERRQREEAAEAQRRQNQRAEDIGGSAVLPAGSEQPMKIGPVFATHRIVQTEPGGGFFAPEPLATVLEQHAGAVIPMPTRVPAAPAEKPTLKLGEINARLSPLSIDDAGLTALGFPPAATEKNAKLRRESDWHAILAAIAQHVVAVANGRKAVA